MILLRATASLAQEPTESLTPAEITIFNDCVKKTIEDLNVKSESSCRTPDYYQAAGATETQTLTVTITIDPKSMPGYQYVPGSQGVARNDGQCTHDVTPVIDSPAAFRCVLRTKGCGFTKEGGHVWGACSVKIRYQPQSGDTVKVKEYCFAQLFGATYPKPSTYSTGCVIQ